MPTDRELYYGLSLPFRHRSELKLVWRVWLTDLRGGCPSPAAFPVVPMLWVPAKEYWTPDTLRICFFELAAHLPPDRDARACVTAAYEKPRGRAPKAGPRRRQFNEGEVRIWVEAAGWKAAVHCWTNELTQRMADGRVFPIVPGVWQEPMQAALLEAADQSPRFLRDLPLLLPHDGYSSKALNARGLQGWAKPSNATKDVVEQLRRLLGGEE